MECYTLITGASSGMGALCAKQFSNSRRLIIASENLEMLQDVLKECANPDQHILWHCNFATYLGHSRKSELKQYVHFAGLTKLLPLKSFSIPDIDLIFNVNFFSILEIIKVLMKKVNAKALENILLISSLASVRGEAGNSVYAASKGAINSLVYSLARELAPNIRVNALMPGAIETPMIKIILDEEYINDTIKDTPLGLVGQQDVVDYVDFLTSHKARKITGQTLFIDGGRSTK